MKIIIDGCEGLVIPEENETLGEVLLQLERWINENRRVIVEVRVEGVVLSEKDKESFLGRKVSEFKKVEIFTANLWHWAIVSLEEIERYLPMIAEEVKKVSSLIHKGNCRNALHLLEKSIRLWEEVNNILLKIENIFALDYAKIFFEKDVLWEVQEIIEFLKQAKKALSENDFLALADVLEYELAPRIKEEKKIIAQIVNILKSQMN